MTMMYFHVQWLRFWHNRKNQAVTLVVLIATLAYCFYSVPSYQPTWPIDPVTIKATRDRRRSELSPFSTSSAVQDYPILVKQATAELAALDKKDYRAYAAVARKQVLYVDERIDPMASIQFYFYPMPYYADDNPFALYDGHYGSQEIAARYLAVSRYRQGAVTSNVVEERTSLQTLQRTISGGLTLFLLLVAVFLANDLVTNDRRHRTVVQGLPLTPWRALTAKTGLAWLATMGITGGFILILILTTVFRYGFGSLGIPTTLFHLPPGRTAYFSTTPLGLYLAKWLVLLALLIWLFTRLTLLLSILFRNEYIPLLLAGGAIFSQALYLESGVGAIKNWTTWALPTYFDVGKILTGYQKYLYQTDQITFNRGLLLISGAVLFVELIVLLVTRRRHFALVH
jgi:hypothetical protein